MLQLRESHRVSQLFGLVLGLSLYSYRVQELLVCWLFFIILFVALALLVIGAVLAWYAGKWATDWARTTVPLTPLPLTPVPVLASAEIHQEAIAVASEFK